MVRRITCVLYSGDTLHLNITVLLILAGRSMISRLIPSNIINLHKIQRQTASTINEDIMMNICECYKLPPNGIFVVGGIYTWSFIIDGISIKDSHENLTQFTEIEWLWYFKKV